MMLQVVNHIGQTYIDGRNGLGPPSYVQEENIPPLEPSTKSMMKSQSSEMSAILKLLANEISTIKSTMSTMQQKSHQQQRPFNPNLHTHTP